MEEVANDIPEGMARIEALDHAMKTSYQGEDPAIVLARAGLYYKFLTSQINGWANETCGPAN